MAALLFLAPLLLLGTAAGQGQAGIDECLLLGNAVEGNFSVDTDPKIYKANQTYVVTIRDDRNHTESSGLYLLQALSPQNSSVGHWEGADIKNCSSIPTATVNIAQNTTRWTSPDSNLSSVQIRVYLSLPDKITELKIFTLDEGAEPTRLPTASTPNSVPTVQSNSLFLAALQLPLLLLTGKLLS